MLQNENMHGQSLLALDCRSHQAGSRIKPDSLEVMPILADVITTRPERVDDERCDRLQNCMLLPTMRIQLGIFRNDSRSAEAVQAMHSPPSTTSAWPVIKDERSEARNRIASAISSTLAKRRIGTLSEM